jgi:hypothetical protein
MQWKSKYLELEQEVESLRRDCNRKDNIIKDLNDMLDYVSGISKRESKNNWWYSLWLYLVTLSIGSVFVCSIIIGGKYGA